MMGLFLGGFTDSDPIPTTPRTTITVTVENKEQVRATFREHNQQVCILANENNVLRNKLSSVIEIAKGNGVVIPEEYLL